MFWIGALVGLLVGATVGMVLLAILVASHESDAGTFGGHP